jgi:hypothetical protein
LPNRVFQPVSPELLADRLAALCEERHPGTHPARVLLDAPDCAELSGLLSLLEQSLLRLGRPVAVVAASGFVRDASVRLENGRTDVESFYSAWLDTAALRREVLDPVADGRPYLPSLRDPASNRSIRLAPVPLAAHGVLVLSGALLLGLDLPAELRVHAAVSRQARRRQTAEEQQWTLPAYDRYDLQVRPAERADVTVRYDDPRHPALSIR